MSIFSCAKNRPSRSHDEIINSHRPQTFLPLKQNRSNSGRLASEDDLVAVAVMESLEAFKISPQNTNSSRQNPPNNLNDGSNFKFSPQPADPQPLASVDEILARLRRDALNRPQAEFHPPRQNPRSSDAQISADEKNSTNKSVESSQQQRENSRAAPVDISQKKNLRTCLSCGSQEKSTDLGISCGQGHYLHGDDCLHTYFEHCLQKENWDKLVPIKCPLPDCKELLLADKVIALMNSEEYERYIEVFIYTNRITKDDEEFLRCPFCKYGVIFTKEKIPLLLFCQGETCSKTSCNICHKQVQVQPSYDEDEYEEGDFGDFGTHFQCEEFKDIKKQIEDAFFEGSINRCPHCGYEGQKDDACTHMQCMRCDEEWCYCCGKKQEELDVPGEEYLGHQNEWQDNKRRCPLYLEEFRIEDEDWPEEGTAAVEMYHQQKTCYLLRKLVEKLDQRELGEALDHFPGLMNGFELKEILEFELIPVLDGRIF